MWVQQKPLTRSKNSFLFWSLHSLVWDLSYVCLYALIFYLPLLFPFCILFSHFIGVFKYRKIHFIFSKTKCFFFFMRRQNVHLKISCFTHSIYSCKVRGKISAQFLDKLFQSPSILFRNFVLKFNELIFLLTSYTHQLIYFF